MKDEATCHHTMNVPAFLTQPFYHSMLNLQSVIQG